MTAGRFRGGLAAVLLASVFLAAHVPFLSKTPHDLDGVNFVLGVRHFDVLHHQPHPPGYPLFIGLGRVARSVVTWSNPQLEASDPFAAASLALSACSALFGALAAFSLVAFFTGLGAPVTQSIAATALTMACPVFWFAAARPLSDLPGLTAAFGALALAIWSVRRAEEPGAARPVASARRLYLAAVLMGTVGAGLRIQVAVLAWPLLVPAWFALRRRGSAPHLASVVGVGLAGGLVWLVPLVVASGGVTAYMHALYDQGGFDFREAPLLATSLSATAAVRALRDSLVTPWGASWFAVPLLLLAVAGIVAWRAHPVRLQLLGGAVIGYLLFHLAFHETAHVRYALPLVPVVSMLAVVGLSRILGRRAVIGWAAVAATALAIGVPPTVLQARTRAPVFQALSALRRELPRHRGERPAVAMHQSIALALRGDPLPAPTLTRGNQHEWLELARFWRQQPDSPAWFLARRRRTDLALIDPAARTLVGRYRWPFDSTSLHSGSRPVNVDLYYLAPPGWVALEGWALTPEVRGVTVRDQAGDDHAEARVQVRRRPGAVPLIVGGRYVDGRCGAAPLLLMDVDGRERRRLPLSGGPSFLITEELPAGVLAGPDAWALLAFRVVDASGRACQHSVAFEQFDLPAAGVTTLAFEDGWYAMEYDTRTGLLWRWMSDRATLRLVHAGVRPMRLRFRGRVPNHRFGPARTLRVTAAGQVLLARSLDAAEFDVDLRLGREILTMSGGTIGVSVDAVVVPAERGLSTDRRRLGLQMLEVVAEPAS